MTFGHIVIGVSQALARSVFRAVLGAHVRMVTSQVEHVGTHSGCITTKPAPVSDWDAWEIAHLGLLGEEVR